MASDADNKANVDNSNTNINVNIEVGLNLKDVMQSAISAAFTEDVSNVIDSFDLKGIVEVSLEKS